MNLLDHSFRDGAQSVERVLTGGEVGFSAGIADVQLNQPGSFQDDESALAAGILGSPLDLLAIGGGGHRRFFACDPTGGARLLFQAIEGLAGAGAFIAQGERETDAFVANGVTAAERTQGHGHGWSAKNRVGVALFDFVAELRKETGGDETEGEQESTGSHAKRIIALYG